MSTPEYLQYRSPVERYVHFHLSDPQDAEDTLQEVWLAAAQGYGALRDKARCREWLLGIARNKCADCLRRRYARREVPLDPLADRLVAPTPLEFSAVHDTLYRLEDNARNLLMLVYFQQLPLREVARQLGIPVGTVKSRLHTARERFRALYPASSRPINAQKGAFTMKNMPLTMPDYTITPMADPPFEVVWEELMGWFLVPRLGEKLTWAMYDFPQRVRTEVDEMRVTGRAEVHGVEGVEISVRTVHPMPCNTVDDQDEVQRGFVAQLTDTHCRFLAETHVQDGVKRLYTFLDGDAFLDNWGFGENNCGNETHLRLRGDIARNGSVITTAEKPYLLDVVDRCRVDIAGTSYDTIRVMDISTYVQGMATEQYLDRSGRTVLWRRFNAEDYEQKRYGRPWTEILPENERITINGKTFVHWYDCITSYIL